MMRSERQLNLALIVCLLFATGCAAALAPTATPALPPTPTSTPAPTATPTPLAIIDAMKSALNSGDADQLMTYFTEEPEYIIDGALRRRGQKAVRDVFDFWIAIHLNETSECAPNKGGLACKARFTDDYHVQFDTTYLAWFEGQKIAKLEIAMPHHSAATIARFEAFDKWVVANHPDEAKELFSRLESGRYNRKTGELEAKLVAEFDAQQK
jgi:hypothetical protein